MIYIYKLHWNHVEGAAFLQSVKEGDQATACGLIYAGTNLDVGYPDGCCPIIKSANFGYDLIVEALVAKVHFLMILYVISMS